MSYTLLIGFLLFLGQPQLSPTQAPCAHLNIIDRLVQWGHKDVNHPRKIEAIIIHSSYNALTPDSFSIAGILQEYKNIGVSPHYIIGRSGVIYRLVRDRNIAYHAGESRLPDGKTDVNAVSIGIEIVNTIHDSPTDTQYGSLAELVKCLEGKYNIKYVLGHSNIAPGRKTDPWNFDWKKFDRLLKGQK
jgi:N-acetyl-anhydromuramyl-L-alanine amidase AmpD